MAPLDDGWRVRSFCLQKHKSTQCAHSKNGAWTDQVQHGSTCIMHKVCTRSCAYHSTFAGLVRSKIDYMEPHSCPRTCQNMQCFPKRATWFRDHEVGPQLPEFFATCGRTLGPRDSKNWSILSLTQKDIPTCVRSLRSSRDARSPLLVAFLLRS